MNRVTYIIIAVFAMLAGTLANYAILGDDNSSSSGGRVHTGGYSGSIGGGYSGGHK